MADILMKNIHQPEFMALHGQGTGHCMTDARMELL